MENFGEALALLPELAPGIIVGTVAGLIVGIYKDVKSDEMGNWWQLGGLGMVLGAVAWFLILQLS